MPDLFLLFVMGFLGSAHCIGMCGGFVLALTQVTARSERLIVHQILYFTGKTVTYALLGAFVGASGAAITGLFQGMQQVLSVAIGFLLIGLGLGLLGMFRRFSLPRLRRRRWSLASVMAHLLRGHRPSGSFGLGLLNGLLPCGLVYAALAHAAATASVLTGTVSMAVFGAGTLPALGMLAVLGPRFSPGGRLWVNRISGVMIVLLGILTIIRGTPLMPFLLHQM